MVASAFAAVFCVPFAQAFSLGPIDVQSGFGEKFQAEIELSQAQPDSLRAFVGSEEDYQKLEKQRSLLVDDLRVHVSEWVRNKRIIRVFSDKPLFYPSLNLVIRVETEGGTLLENYLVAVDFRQSVKLGLKGRKTSEEPEAVLAPAPTGNEPVLLEKSEIEKTPEPSPAPGQASTASPVDEPKAQVKDEEPPQSDEQPTPEPKPVVETAKAELEAPEKPPEILEKETQIEAPEATPEPKTEPESSPETKPVLERVRPGDSLLKISRRLKIDSGKAARFAVAVWMDNKDKFLGGNVHGVQKGATLNLTAVSARMQELDDGAARENLKSQWKEWKNRAGSPEEPGAGGAVVEMALPAEGNPDPEGLSRLLKDWRDSWESGNLERHLDHFTDGSPQREEEWLKKRFADLTAYKRKIFQDNKNVKVEIGKPVVEKRRSYWLVSFDQKYRSDSSESAGRKTLKLIRRDGKWKILNEWIHLRKSGGVQKARDGDDESEAGAAGSMESPFVVHISDHEDLDSATRSVNQLRRKGYGAYSSLVASAQEGKSAYQVFVGRFSDWDETERVTKSVRRMEAGKSASPMRFPYTLETGTFASDREAIEFVKALRGKGFSSYLHRSFVNRGEGMQVKVMAGAYLEIKDLEAVAREMEKRGIAHSIAAP